MTRPDWKSAKRVLVVRLDNLGDVLMTGPAMRAIKENLPGSWLTLLTSPAAEQGGRMLPEVDDVMVYDAPWMKATDTRSSSQPDLAMIERLNQEQFDAAVIFTVYSQNPLPAALLAYLADIPLRLAHCRENPYQLLTDWVKETEPDQGIRHETRRQLDLVEAVGFKTADEHMRIQVSQHDQDVAMRKLKEVGVNTNAPWVVIHPGASAPSRRYSPQGFAEAARQLMNEDHLQVVYSGVESECALIEFIRGLSPGAFSLAGCLNLGEMAGLLKMSPLLISNNTGPVHMASSLGTPVVVLYALTNPQHTPWMVPSRVLNHDVPCKYCYKSVCPEMHHNCLRLVKPYAVVQAARELLKPEHRQAERNGSLA